MRRCPHTLAGPGGPGQPRRRDVTRAQAPLWRIETPARRHHLEARKDSAHGNSIASLVRAYLDRKCLLVWATAKPMKARAITTEVHGASR